MSHWINENLQPIDVTPTTPACPDIFPTFTEHMRGLMQNQTRVVVSTGCGDIDGRIAGVFNDHLLIRAANGVRHHVLLRNICWVSEGS